MTIRNHILEYLKTHGPSWGGVVCRAVHDLTGSKEAVIERRCRELVSENKIDVCYKQIEGHGPKCTRYRIHQEPQIEVKPHRVSISYEGYNVEYPVEVKIPQSKLNI